MAAVDLHSAGTLVVQELDGAGVAMMTGRGGSRVCAQFLATAEGSTLHEQELPSRLQQEKEEK